MCVNYNDVEVSLSKGEKIAMQKSDAVIFLIKPGTRLDEKYIDEIAELKKDANSQVIYTDLQRCKWLKYTDDCGFCTSGYGSCRCR